MAKLHQIVGFRVGQETFGVPIAIVRTWLDGQIGKPKTKARNPSITC